MRGKTGSDVDLDRVIGGQDQLLTCVFFKSILISAAAAVTEKTTMQHANSVVWCTLPLMC